MLKKSNTGHMTIKTELNYVIIAQADTLTVASDKN